VIACPSVLAQFRPEAVEKGIDNISVRTFHDMTYTIPNQLVEYAMRNGHVPVGFWRAPGLQNSYYRECFIDEVAHAAGKDPLEFRLALLKDGDKNKGVLQAVAKAAQWGEPLPAGVFSRHAQFGRIRQLHRDGCGSVGERRPRQGPPRRGRDRLGLRGQSRHVAWRKCRAT
jgi:isoquinoline 1-oxidoreductase beta subunit